MRTCVALREPGILQTTQSQPRYEVAGKRVFRANNFLISKALINNLNSFTIFSPVTCTMACPEAPGGLPRNGSTMGGTGILVTGTPSTLGSGSIGLRLCLGSAFSRFALEIYTRVQFAACKWFMNFNFKHSGHSIVSVGIAARRQPK